MKVARGLVYAIFSFFVHMHYSQSSLDSLAKSQETSEGMSLEGRSRSKHSEDAVDSAPVPPIPALPMARLSHSYMKAKDRQVEL